MICDKGHSWNPSNCECECNKSCGIGEYLDYKSCFSKKTIVDKLIEECNTVVEENNNNTLVTSSNSDCTPYFSSFLVFLLLFLIIRCVFLYFYWHKRLDTKNKRKKTLSC